MITNLKPYPAMKDSGVEWLGEVPEHWEVRRGKNLFRCIDIRSETGGEELLTVSSERGIVPRRSASVTMFKAESYVGYKLCWPGDLVINSLWAWARGLGVSNYYGIISTAYGVYRPKKSINSRFIHELVRSIPFHWELRVRSKGVWTSRLQLTDDSFLCAPFPLPPLPEQTAIVRFLDHIDRRVRRYIRAKQKLIKLLEEQKQAIIHRAVTRGLDPDVPLKPSGVEWLGDVPAHWEVRKLRFDFRYAKGSRAAELTNEYIEANPGPFRVFSGQTENNGLMGSISWHEFNFENDAILVTTVGARAMSTRLVSGAFSLSQNCAVIVPRDNRRSSLYYEMVMRRLFKYEKASISLIMQPSLRFSDLNRFYIPAPPFGEQVAIVEYLDQATAGIGTTITRAHREISLLREYRTRLIADVVTGKLDVREAAAKLPDETNESESLDEMDAIGNGGEERADDLDTAQEEVEA